MRVSKLIGVLIAVLAISAVAVATASAAETLWQWLPGAEKTAFTGKSKKATLQVEGGAAITCQESTTTGEITTEKTLGTATIKFGTKCTAAGLPVENEGSKEAGKITVKVKIHNCVIKSGDAGEKIEVEGTLKLEVPSTKLKLSIKGALIGLIAPNKEKKLGPFTLTIAQTGGLQAIKQCEGGAATFLLTSINGGTFTESGQEAEKGEINFTTAEQEIMV